MELSPCWDDEFESLEFLSPAPDESSPVVPLSDEVLLGLLSLLFASLVPVVESEDELPDCVLFELVSFEAVAVFEESLCCELESVLALCVAFEASSACSVVESEGRMKLSGRSPRP